MTLGAKLTTSFLSIAIGVALVGLLGLYLVTRVADDYGVIADESVPALTKLREIRSQSINMVEAVVSHALINTQKRSLPAQQMAYQAILADKEQTEFNHARMKMGEALNQYVHIAVTDHDRKLAATISQSQSQVYSLGDQLMTLASDGVKVQQVLKKREQLWESTERLLSVIDNAIDDKMVSFEEAKASASNAVRTAVLITSIAIVLASSLARVLGLVISRSLVKSVARLRDAAEKIGDGRLDVRIGRLGGVEFDGLGTAFNKMAGDLQSSHAKLEQHAQKLHEVNEKLQESLDYQTRLSAELEQAKSMAETLARRDALTGLCNHAAFIDHLKQAIERSGSDKNNQFAVLFLDFDRFKVINDSLGHQVGDELLVGIGERIRGALRANRPDVRRPRDAVGRIGGDEFVVLLEDIDSTQEAVTIADRIQEKVSAPFQLDGHEVFISVSIGIVGSESGYDCPEALLRDADIAMYHAKAAGKARHIVFDNDMREQAVKRLGLEGQLRKALQRQEFKVVYQPIVSLESGHVVGFEALLRWSHPQQGLILPAQFIPIAEETGLIVPIGLWVLSHACQQLRNFQEILPNKEPLWVSVNLSRRQLCEPNLVDQIARQIRTNHIAPQTLKLEVTENSITQDTQGVIPAITQLRDMGVQICMDDFGTGMSSLSCLHSFPIDVLKIDRAFIHNAAGNVQYVAVIDAIVTLAHNLGLSVVAEGVETPEQVAQLQALECDYAQGCFFSAAMEEQQVAGFLALRDQLPKSA